MTDPLEFLAIQYQQRIKQEHESTKLYFQSIVLLGAGFAAAITALASLMVWASNIDPSTVSETLGVATIVLRAVPRMILCGIPLFLTSWFGCYLFMYWEHHMMRLSVDYSERMAAEKLGLQDETYLYHSDFLGVFNEARFPLTRWVPARCRPKSVQVVFVAIGLPAGVIYILAGAQAYFLIAKNHEYWALAYAATLLALLIVLLWIHIHCVKRERTLKSRLGIKTKWEGDKPAPREGL